MSSCKKVWCNNNQLSSFFSSIYSIKGSLVHLRLGGIWHPSAVFVTVQSEDSFIFFTSAIYTELSRITHSEKEN